MNVDRLLGQTGNERDGKLRANRDLCAHPHIRTIGSNVYRRIDRLHWSVGQKGKLVHSIDPCDATRNGGDRVSLLFCHDARLPGRSVQVLDQIFR